MGKFVNEVYFAGMNTAQGFVSYFNEIFGGCKKIYVIKGGPGTGKSRLMNDIAQEAELRGLETEKFLCSSDPCSLDGLIIKNSGTAIVDGTSPHIYEPTAVGLKEKIVDVSAFLDPYKLNDHSKDIFALLNAKSRKYNSIYSYLKVIGVYDNEINTCCKNAYLEDKAEKIILKLSRLLKKDSSYQKRILPRSAVGFDGEIVLGTYSSMASKRYALTDICGISGDFLQKLLSVTDEKRISVFVSFSPLCPSKPDALFYPASGISFYTGSETDNYETVLNMRRFINDEKLRPYKPQIRALTRLRNGAVKQMEFDFKAIKRLHMSLEEIYISAMDFSGKEKLTKQIIKEIFT